MGEVADGVADVAFTWTDVAGTTRAGRVRLAAYGIPPADAAALLASALRASKTPVYTVTDQTSDALARPITTSPAARAAAARNRGHDAGPA